MSYLQFKQIMKEYEGDEGATKAVNDANFSIEKGELVVFVGPSGCGKSTFLRMVAGLEEITGGEMILDGEVINDIEVQDRDVAMVFQDYALYPHMTVKQNLSFGLENQKVKKAVIKEKIETVIQVLELEGLEERYPKQLSGGQRQRVALGRAIVKDPKVFLLDEPLSNLDARLRVNTRKMIADLHKTLQSTMIYVTHDQIEAMTLGDKIVVMNKGEVQQIDTPENIYLDPRNTFVANFIGTPAMNLLPARVTQEGQILVESERFTLPDETAEKIKAYESKEVIMGIRPESIQLDVVDHAEPHTYKPTFIEFLGSENIVYFDFFGSELIVKVTTPHKLSEEDFYTLTIDESKICLFDKETTQRIV
jgi:multiple sugar transport system ATP-binding protein